MEYPRSASFEAIAQTTSAMPPATMTLASPCLRASFIRPFGREGVRPVAGISQGIAPSDTS